MSTNRSAYQWFSLLVSVLAIALTGCTGDSGSSGSTGAPGATIAVASPSAATALTMSITGVTISSPPVVNFTVTNQDGAAVAGLTSADLRFNIAKLNPGMSGAPSTWQNYIVRSSGGAMQGSQERDRAGYPWGTFVDHKDGTYTYTFATDITSAAANPCPAPCTDADGNALDISYQPTLTTRVTIQQSNSAYPKYNAIYDFVPAGGPVATGRDIVQTANCNECHNKLTAHGSRIETKLCVTCHNPGSWVAGTPNTTVDFKVMIHKIHRGEELPSVVAGGTYAIGSHDFSDVVFPQDIRNCTKCHTNTDAVVARNTSQGDNWETKPSIAACGSCHDDIDFSVIKSATNPDGHPGGVVAGETDSSVCLGCHTSGLIGGSIAEDHTDPVKAIAAKYKFNLISVTGGTMPSIQFSITDPTNANAPYDIASGDAASNPVFKTPSTSRLAIVVGWSTSDFNNAGSGTNPAQPISVDPVNACDGTPVADWACTVSSGVYTLTKLSALPAGATGTGRVGFEGHPAAPDTATPPAYTVRVPIKSLVKDWSIDGSAVKARRTVVDIAKCDQCHAQLSLHGNNRTDEPQLCVICHNPNDTDAARRPKTAAGILAGGVDGLFEQSIDFKRMIHGIHGAGMRTNAFVVYGYGGSVNDFSDVRFPGILNDCTTCHTTSSYQLTGLWETPTSNGILASTVRTTPTATDAATYATELATPDDDLNITPTAAVCSSCHDDALALQHMTAVGSAVFSATQTAINSNIETCSICHGPGGIADLKVVHSVP